MVTNVFEGGKRERKAELDRAWIASVRSRKRPRPIAAPRVSPSMRVVTMSLVIRIFSFRSVRPAKLGLFGESNPRENVGGTGFKPRSRVRHTHTHTHTHRDSDPLGALRRRDSLRVCTYVPSGTSSFSRRTVYRPFPSVERRKIQVLPVSLSRASVRSSSAFAFHGSRAPTPLKLCERAFASLLLPLHSSCCFAFFFYFFSTLSLLFSLSISTTRHTLLRNEFARCTRSFFFFFSL